ncbi:hypothetical protein [Cellulosimicrobium sp. Marseille-Q4280]|uniref:hypothetical protein n=1 Tax=Cellulosimicrobium sp. Marseille-Q4280 TaxID=2937992 RepID=UPI00203FDD1B|nr:hypothetical protein [Cellulosimicrobium sp. Marseille-Q4280]
MTTITLTRRTVTQSAKVTGIEPVVADGEPRLMLPTGATLVVAGGRAQSIELEGTLLREDGSASRRAASRTYHRTSWSGWAHVPGDVADLVAALEAAAQH